MTVSQQLRKALEECGQTRAEVARETGIPESVLSRFANKVTALRGPHTDTLAKHLRLELVPKKGK